MPVVESSIPDGPIQQFINKLGNWKFNMPSNNLWTVEILLHNDGSGDQGTHTLSKLYEQICLANRKFDEQIGGYWRVTPPDQKTAEESFGTDYISLLQGDDAGLFLAQGVKYATHRAQINPNIADSLLNHSGFMTWGMTTSGKSAGQEANIQFLETNWDIGAILFDKWIAAVLQQGLVEDETLADIKSDIIIKKYSASIDEKMVNSRSYDQKKWQLRETIKLIKAVPLSYEGNQYFTYDPPTAPKIITVNFNYTDYVITYHV